MRTIRAGKSQQGSACWMQVCACSALRQKTDRSKHSSNADASAASGMWNVELMQHA